MHDPNRSATGMEERVGEASVTETLCDAESRELARHRDDPVSP
ncbi:MAG TPA: hypothetical protein VF814_07480 [Casimicrobiaceae bacterium]